MIKQEIEKDGKIIELKSGEYLDTVFPDGLPCNSIIDKTACGIGGTTLELNWHRHSIFVVPNLPIIANKMLSYEDIIGVHGKISKKELAEKIEYILGKGGYLKFMTTPDSFGKLVEVCQVVGFDLYNECFLLWDEFHTMITELSYRDNMIKPLDYLFDFKDKSLISATHYEASDPRFEKFDRIKIAAKHINDTLDVVFTEDIYAVLKSLIDQVREMEEVNLHIFYNSVKSISEFLLLLDKNDDVSIFCANKKENYAKLGEFGDRLASFEKSEFKRVNLYTSKYYEGWDLHDKNAVIVMVSDVTVEHTCFNIRIKGVQAIGRLRDKAKGVYHITNSRNKASIDKASEMDNIHMDTQNGVIAYNYLNEKMVFRDESFMEAVRDNIKTADFNEYDSTATVNLTKVDAKVYGSLSNHIYDNEQSIIDCWEKAGYTVNVIHSNLVLKTEERKFLRNNRFGKPKKNKLIIDKIKEFKECREISTSFNGGYIFNLSGLFEYQDLIKKHPRLYQYFTYLGYEKMVELNFSSTKMEKAYVLANVRKLEVSDDLKKIVYNTFFPRNTYSSTYIKYELGSIFKSLGANSKKVKASDITKYFDAQELTYWDKENKKHSKGYRLDSKRL